MTTAERDLVESLRFELAAVDPPRRCCRIAEIAGLAGAFQPRRRMVTRVILRLRGRAALRAGGSTDPSIVGARAVGDDPWLAWLLMTLSIVAVLVAAILLLASILCLVLMEGTQVFVDELGIAVELAYLPKGFAHWLGAGRIPWKKVGTLKRSGPLFVIVCDGRNTEGAAGEPLSPIRFLVVDEIERLVNLILERSPNITFLD